MTTAPAFETAERRAPRARPQLPRPRAVLMEQLRTTWHALRGAALVAAALLALLTLWVALQSLSREVDVSLNAWPTQLPGLVGALLPIAVWARDERFGPGFLWTLPVDRRRHALTKVLAGWVWLMGGVALFVLWLLALTLATGGRLLPETLRLTTFEVAAAGPVDPAVLRTVRWAPGPLIWAVPFTAATATYLLASVLTLGSRHPLRWVIDRKLSFVLSTVASQAASARLRVGWLDRAPEQLLRLLLESRYGLDALLTARIESLNSWSTLTTGERALVWWGVPDLADWRTATLLWTGAGLLALWAAASRHRERRRA
ncbi:MAG: hypothetical protein AVDCRST_MAG11-1923 [uncultured Gemmatimonadaceae bacterium]|uniref:Uncharacterized protein n=1 Tax=uncultured Gemmatimonadaceae bacterium TaxID=246130 RepID=A0A6J4KZX1_9BACT|nr:MAG: hypothetical protein AVDCRST_MAG11-1923 [uncultured Gemmatimonadaceae bacterium]